eukprot:3211153-Rhodomonas_salina.1
MHDMFVEPSKQNADLIIPFGGRNVAAIQVAAPPAASQQPQLLPTSSDRCVLQPAIASGLSSAKRSRQHSVEKGAQTEG